MSSISPTASICKSLFLAEGITKISFKHSFGFNCLSGLCFLCSSSNESRLVSFSSKSAEINNYKGSYLIQNLLEICLLQKCFYLFNISLLFLRFRYNKRKRKSNFNQNPAPFQDFKLFLFQEGIKLIKRTNTTYFFHCFRIFFDTCFWKRTLNNKGLITHHFPSVFCAFD